MNTVDAGGSSPSASASIRVGYMKWTTINKSRKGFSLIELMAVLLIISVLISIAIMVFREGQPQETARDRVDIANVRALNGATTIWVVEDPYTHNPRDHTTASLRAIIEDYLIMGWPESPTGRDYILQDGQWVLDE